KNKKLVEQINIKDTAFSAVLFEKAIGKIPSTTEWNKELFLKCGETIAKMHNLSEENNKKDDKIYINDWIIQDEYNTKKYIPLKFQKLHDKCDSIYEEISTLPKNDSTYGVIHSDICLGNFFINNGEITLFDFQDCEQHYFINDLAIFIYFAIYNSFNGDNLNDYAENLIKHLFIGYKKERQLDNYWVKQLPLFMKLREVLSLSQTYRYGDIDKLDDDNKILLNMYRRNIENDLPATDIDFDSILENIN
ncbi:MAG: phosphotransferase, partial [bacterium]|nr:phosphotransferase [bacterium]